MLTRFLFIRFNLYLPLGAHLCLFSSLSTFSRRWADKGYLGAGEIPCVQTQKSPCCHPERCLTCSFFRNKVCVSVTPPMPFHHQMETNPGKVRLITSLGPAAAHLWLLPPNSSFLIILESFVFSQDRWGTACQEIFAGHQMMITAEMLPVAQLYPPSLQLSRAGGDLSEPW